MTIARHLQAGIRRLAANPETLAKVTAHTATLPADEAAHFLAATIMFAGLPKKQQAKVAAELRAELKQPVSKPKRTR